MRLLGLSAPKSRAAAVVGVPKALQLTPALVEYCQVPLVLSTAMTAMPSRAPASTSVMGSPPAPVAMRSKMVSPPGVASSSFTAVSAGVPELSSTGALFAPSPGSSVTVTLSVCVSALPDPLASVAETITT